jgi:hypothetical protein
LPSLTWIQAKVVYCHKAAEGVTPEQVAKAGFGAGVSSGGTVMASVTATGGDPSMSMAGMSAMSMGGGMPDMSAMMRQAMAMSGGGAGFGGMPGMQMQQAPKEDGVVGGQAVAGPKVQQMRMVGHIRQKSIDIPEATPIVQEKIATGIAGLF